jgi:DNA-binding transcriptional MerR regulator
MADTNAELMAVPRLADSIGVTPRVFRYWVELGLVTPSREHGKLRFAPHDLAAARLVKRLLEQGVGVDGVRMLRDLAERRVRAALDGSEIDGLALSMLYERKAFRSSTGHDPEHDPEGPPPPGPGGQPPPGPGGPPPPPGPGGPPRP